MSPATFSNPIPEGTQAHLDRVWALFGDRIREQRLARRWSARRLADRAGVSRALVYLVERGEPTSLEAAARITMAVGLRLELALTEPRSRQAPAIRAMDPVHAAMAELEAGRLRVHGPMVAIDEPYQHYQYHGRADVMAWQSDTRELVHIENRTQFPDMQAMAGSWNSKRAYLADSIGERVGVRRWISVTHVMVALWSAEVVRVLRRHPETFRALCPDGPDAFTAWWDGTSPSRGTSSSLVLLDPFAGPRQREYVGLAEALEIRPRLRGYAEAAARLRADAR